jgi:formylglycine-generating enzyme required for sulfatase activity
LHDVCGNVAEWCLNSYFPYGRSRASREQRGSVRIVRGGAFDDGPPRLRSARRERASVDTRSVGIGLRAARKLDA